MKGLSFILKITTACSLSFSRLYSMLSFCCGPSLSDHTHTCLQAFGMTVWVCFESWSSLRLCTCISRSPEYLKAPQFTTFFSEAELDQAAFLRWSVMDHPGRTVFVCTALLLFFPYPTCTASHPQTSLYSVSLSSPTVNPASSPLNSCVGAMVFSRHAPNTFGKVGLTSETPRGFSLLPRCSWGLLWSC